MSEDLKQRSGSLCAPDRHPIDWQSEKYYQPDTVLTEMDRIFEICHGCRRCHSLCQAFPTLFDLIDSSASGDLEPENHRKSYGLVADQCYLCDRCYMNKCPYTPPHEWAVDFPHVMLQMKAQKLKKGEVKLRDKILTSTEVVGKFAGIPIVVNLINKVNKVKPTRKLLEKTFGIAADSPLPEFHHKTLRKTGKTIKPEHADAKVVLFSTCYCNYNRPDIGEDLIKVFEHNQIEVVLPKKQTCCGMPKFELGDFVAIAKNKEQHVKLLLPFVEQGFDIVAPVPSCVLMFKQELPLLFPTDAALKKIRNAFYDPFDYLVRRYKAGKLNTDFKHSLGDISYHVACHLEVQNIGPKTQQLLQLIPGTKISTISRCSGHDGTYAVKKEFRQNSLRIGKPVFTRVDKDQANYYTSDCPIAAAQIASQVQREDKPLHPFTLLRKAYGI